MKKIFAKNKDKADDPSQQSLYEVQTKRLKDLQDELNAGTLVEELQKNNSFKRNFLLSLVKGVGTAIGATLIAGIALTVFVKILQSSENIPIIGEYVEQSKFLNELQEGQ